MLLWWLKLTLLYLLFFVDNQFKKLQQIQDSVLNKLLCFPLKDVITKYFKSLPISLVINFENYRLKVDPGKM